MKPRVSHIAVVALLLLLSACRENSPIELAENSILEPIEVFLPKERDTTVVQETTLDLTGLIQQDSDNYPGTVLVTGVKSDIGGSRTQLAYSRILLKDLRSPKTVRGNFGSYTAYDHLDVGKAKLDSVQFDFAEWIIQIKSVTLLPVKAGFFYKLGYDGYRITKPIDYLPRHRYVVEAEGKGQIGSFDLTFDSPDEVTLLNPRPQALVFRDEDLVIRWSGQAGNFVRVIISTYDETRGRAVNPLMVIKASPHSNSLLVSSKLLKLVPPSANGRLMMTFMSANRREATLQGYPDKVLLQAASIHNLTISLR
ncbi:MAG: hypothetical protein AABZ02_05675 [Bacteroidota bacterium]